MNKQPQYSLLRHYLMSKQSFFTLESDSDATEEEKKLIRAARKALEKAETSGRSFAAYDVEGDLLKDEKPSKQSLHPDDLPDTYNRTGPSLARQKKSGYPILRRHLVQKIAEECAACGMDEEECDCEECKAASEAWTRSEGKNPEGGLNAKGRASYNKATGGNLKAPVSSAAADKSPAKAKRRSSFCSRMCGMKAKRTGSDTANDPDSRINKALRKWDCKCSSVKEAARVNQLQIQSYMPQGKKRKLTDKELKEIEDKSSRILPTIFTSNATPITEAMYSPGTSAVLMGLLGGGVGAGTGLAANQLIAGRQSGEYAPLAALLGGLLGAGVGGVSGYFGGKARNEGYADAMSRLPVNATMRDYYADPLVQRDLDREMERARTYALML